ncbi:OLC1v1028917C1 [Oldenlandia corymbosa var. corymbosa]|uniref:Beta-amylase n=1 Tax=Oldenlandia corymbosa var. corymbosa TaxID=529605 RepID=A0AAV1CFI7_OLDCO|nr:OLC1v1028917C1 [Oldenlandia corymbosa var. corymbosa]
MAIASPSPPAPSFSTSSFCCNRTDSLTPPHPSTRFSRIRFRRIQFPATRPLTVVSRLKASSSLNTPSNGFEFDGDLQYELQHGGVSTPQHHRRGSPVFVTLPLDAISSSSGQMKRSRAMAQSFRALAAAGVEGVVMEVWWGLVERESPRVYNWQGYLEIVLLAKRYGLKVRAVMAFHQCGSGPGDPFWISLPQWVLEEMDRNPDLAYSDRFGRRNMEYLSLGCDTIPVLRGRSPIQVYTDFMRSFRDSFRPFLGGIITGVQVGLGPAGELRYPSCPSQKLTWPWRSRELGEFQCYDKYMLASLNACASERGVREWANGGPIGASNLMHDPESTEFFKSDGSWNTPYGEFFLEWYSGLLILHGDRICSEAETIFRGTKVNMSGKVAGIHWHYGTQSHASELTAGYYNTSTKDGYLPIARMFARYGFTMRCTCFEMQDVEEQQMNPVSSPEGFLKQLLLAARACDIPMEGENLATNLDDGSFHQVLKMSKLFSDGLERPSFSFNFNRMDKNLFEYHNWVNFTRFVRQMSDFSIFRAKLDFGGGGATTTAVLSSSFGSGAVFAY